MADLLKQMWFLMTIQVTNYGIRGRQADKRQTIISIKTMSELGQTLVNITICLALLKCTATEFRTWAVLTVFFLYTKSEM